jgi:hypothetical protein
MSQKVVHGFAWYAYPDVFGLEDEEVADPGHPFASSSGKVALPAEVLYYRSVHPADSGCLNQRRNHAYLVLSKDQHHPRLCNGWESEPAELTDKFKTGDGKVKMGRIVQHHKRHAGNLLEIELKLEAE